MNKRIATISLATIILTISCTGILGISVEKVKSKPGSNDLPPLLLPL